jgi:hypothetical protein
LENIMLKIKPFLLALCLSPLSLTVFQAPVHAQANFTTSQGQAGVASGVNISASGTTVFSSPANNGNSNNASTQVLVSPAQISALGQATTAVLQTLAADGSVASSTTLVLITSNSTLAPVAVPAALGNAQAAIANAPTTGTTTRTIGGVTVTASAATSTTGQTFSASRGGTSLGSVVTATGTTSGSVTVGGVTVAVPPIANATLATNASQAAIAVLLAGGSATQAAAAAQIAGTGAGIGASVRLVAALAGISTTLSTDPNASNPLVPNLNASRLKSLDLAKELVLAQGKAGSVTPAKLAEAIIAYNEVIDTSSPEVVVELSKNKSFLQIGETLRKLRSAFGD